MAERRRSRRRTLLPLLVVASLVLVTLDYRQGDTGVVATLERGARQVFTPLQEGLAAVVRPVGDFFGAVGDLARVRRTIERLEEDNRQLRTEQVSRAELEQENAELRALLDVPERRRFTTTGAHVIAQPPSAFEFSVLIDKGADDGIRPGMAVINAQGLVGKVTEVTPGNARVQLLSSPNARYVVRVAETREDGLLRGRGSRPFQLEIINPEATIERGAEVVTRAFAGTSIPDGLRVGMVEEGNARPGGTRFLDVRPHVDFAKVSFVLVVLDAPMLPTDLPESERLEEDDPARPPPPPSPSPSPTAGISETETTAPEDD